jgi:hypothetical protein
MIQSAYCHVINGEVTLEIDMEGSVASIFCPEYDSITRECRLKRRTTADGPLAQLLDRSMEHRLAERGARCPFRP